MQEREPSFSHNLYPGLDEALDASWAGSSISSEYDAEGIDFGQLLSQELILQPDAYEWASQKLGNAQEPKSPLGILALKEELLEQEIPCGLDDLLEMQPHHTLTLQKLYETRQILAAEKLKTSQRIPLEYVLSPVLVPWGFFKKYSQNLPTKLPFHEGGQIEAVWNEIMGAQNIYPNPSQRTPRTSAEDYLNQRIERDGDWGVILAQTSSFGGLEAHKASIGTACVSPDEIVDSSGRYVIAGQDVGGMGIFEWLALVMQYPRAAESDASYLMAHRQYEGNHSTVISALAGMLGGQYIIRRMISSDGSPGYHARITTHA